MSEDWTTETTKRLLTATEQSIARARYVFMALNVASILMIAAHFNLYFPWARHILNRPGLDSDTKKAVEQLLWSDLYTITVPLLGLKINADDLLIFGNVGLIVLLVWYRFALRSELTCLRACEREFTRALSNKREKARCIWTAVNHRMVFSLDTGDLIDPEDHKIRAHAAVRLLVRAPALGSMFAWAVSGSALFVPYTLNATGKPLAQQITDPIEWADLGLRLAFGLVAALWCWSAASEAIGADETIRSLLNEMKKKLGPDDPSVAAPPPIVGAGAFTTVDPDPGGYQVGPEP